MNLLDATKVVLLFCYFFHLQVSFVWSADLSRDDLKFLFGDKHPSRASFVNIRIKNNRVKRETTDVKVTIDEGGMNKKNSMEENHPDGQMISEFKPVEKVTIRKDGSDDKINFLSSSDLKYLRVKMKKSEGDSSVEGVVSEANEGNMKSLFQDFLISNNADTVKNLGKETPDRKEQIAEDGIEITIEDEANSIDFMLHPNKELFSDNFSVIVRDSVNNTDGGEEFQYTEKDTKINCVYVGESETNPDIQVALTNCNGEGFTGLIIAGDKTHLIRPVNSNIEPKKRKRRETTEAETMDEGLHVVHEAVRKEKCGVHDEGAMSVPKRIVKLDTDLNPLPAVEEAFLVDDEVIRSLKDKREPDVRQNGQTLDQMSVETRRKLSNKQSTNSFGDSGHRSKRQTETYTIETAVFVDDVMYDVVDSFKEPTEDTIKKVESIVFAIMNGVSRLYKQSSMKTNMELKLKQLQVIKSSSAGPSKSSGEIGNYLKKFCEWQDQLMTKSGPIWDHALMISGLNLYSGTKANEDVVGLAYVGGMCDSKYSCTINEGTSFEAVYVIAHEIGHNLGMYHDGNLVNRNTCSDDNSIMSAATGPGKVTWSSCSNEELEKFLDNDQRICLKSEFSLGEVIDLSPNGKLPGELFTGEMQCKYALGEKYQIYTTTKAPHDDICRELWCHNTTHATRTHPALDGTKCSTEKNYVCITGRCVDSSQFTDAPETTKAIPSTASPITSLPGPPDNNNIHLITSHDWVLKNHTICSASCGGGYLSAKVVCETYYSYSNNIARKKRATEDYFEPASPLPKPFNDGDEMLCDLSRKPATKYTCNVAPCRGGS